MVGRTPEAAKAAAAKKLGVPEDEVRMKERKVEKAAVGSIDQTDLFTVLDGLVPLPFLPSFLPSFLPISCL